MVDTLRTDSADFKAVKTLNVWSEKPVAKLAINFIQTLFFVFGALFPAISSAQDIPSHDEPMRFFSTCAGNAYESCYMTGIGIITPDTPAEYLQHVSENGGKPFIYLSSRGGSLKAGLELGRLFREHDMITLIGDEFLMWKEETEGRGTDGYDSFATNPEYKNYEPFQECNSACAYAFLGGTTRHIPSGTRLGFHQFSSTKASLDENTSQNLAAAILAYILEMGVDARLFISASTTDFEKMHYVTEAEAKEIGILRPEPFSDLVLEMYNGGIIAFSKRNTPLRPYDRTTQITFYCRSPADAYAMLTTTGPEDPFEFETPYTKGIWSDSPGHLGTNDFGIYLPAKSVQQRSIPGALLYEIKLKKTWIEQLFKADVVSISVERSRGWGGDARIDLSLDDEQRNSLKAAFHFCID